MPLVHPFPPPGTQVCFSIRAAHKCIPVPITLHAAIACEARTSCYPFADRFDGLQAGSGCAGSGSPFPITPCEENSPVEHLDDPPSSSAAAVWVTAEAGACELLEALLPPGSLGHPL